MDFVLGFTTSFIAQLQSSTLGFLMGGMLIAALGSNLKIPNSIYQFIVFVLLMKIGLDAGIEIRQADWRSMLVPAFFAIVVGVVIVVLGSCIFARLPGIRYEDGVATAGLFGAVSASTLAVAMVLLDQESIAYEAWAPALYPFMDIPALIIAIVIANVYSQKSTQDQDNQIDILGIVKESLRGSALSALILGLLLGLLTNSESVLENFYEPLFRGFLSILMLVMGMEAYARLNELRKVAHWYVLYAFFAPIIHGLIGFGLGYLAHLWVGFSAGGTILLAVIAASNSDISGPPTLRGGIPTANPSAYIGASTSVGTPVAIAICIPLFIALAQVVFN